MKPPRVMVLHNAPTLPADHPDAYSEHDVLDTANHVVKILRAAGIPVEQFSFVYDLHDLLCGLDEIQPDVVFNLYEGTAGWSHSEAYVGAALELMKVPYTGSTAETILLARSKPVTKQLLLGAGLPTSRFVALEDGDTVPVNPLGWPVIVKPSREDASVGIDQGAVVTTQEQLEARITLIRSRYGPALHFEQFIRGREFHVAVVATDGPPRALPFSEIFFHKDALWPIVSFNAKWHEESEDFIATPVKNPADVEPVLQSRVAALAVKAFRLLGCRDYARLDFRVREDGEPFILEVNPNPCISPLAGVAEGLASAGIPFSEFILSLVRSALRRGPHPQMADFPNRAVEVPYEAADEPSPGVKSGPPA